MRKCVKERIEAGKCIRCGGEKNVNPKNCSACLKIQAEQAVTRRLKVRERVFEAYGGFVCNCCGETMRECLSIDHVNNDGHVHRKITGHGSTFYRWLIRNNFPKDFQVLCMNCQFGKKHNGGVCPHQK